MQDADLRLVSFDGDIYLNIAPQTRRVCRNGSPPPADLGEDERGHAVGWRRHQRVFLRIEDELGRQASLKNLCQNFIRAAVDRGA